MTRIATILPAQRSQLIQHQRGTFYVRKRSDATCWEAVCYVRGEKGRVRRWSTGIQVAGEGSRDAAVAAIMDALSRPLVPLREIRKRGKMTKHYRAPSFIYFIRSGGKIKIGTTRDMAGRISKMRADCPVPMEVIGRMLGDSSEEKALHERFMSTWSHGEWFHESEELLALAAQHANGI